MMNNSSSVNGSVNGTDTAPNLGIWFHFSCGVLAIVANVLVLAIAFTKIDLRVKLNQVFVVSMTVADLVFGFVHLFSKPMIHLLPLSLCGPYYILLWICQMASCIFLLYLNIDKFLSLYKPLQYPTMITRKLVLTQTLLTWLLFSLFITFQYYWSPWMERNDDSEDCAYAVTPHKFYYALYIMVCYVLPVLLSIGISGYIFWIATFSGSHLGHSRHQKRRKQLWLRILFVFSSTVWTCMTFLPYRVAYARYLFCVFETIKYQALDGDEKSCMTPELNVAMTLFWYALSLGAVGNPCITILTQRTYCLALSKYVPCLNFYASNDRERNGSMAESRRISVFTSLLTPSLPRGIHQIRSGSYVSTPVPSPSRHSVANL